MVTMKIHQLLLVLFLLFHVFFESINGENSSAFDFLKHLGGAHKGNNLKGLQELKKYLTHYGYLDYEHNSHDNKNHASDDFFDDLLEFAVKKYQTFFKINITGKLDAETIAKMSLPRCGVRDFLKPNESHFQMHRPVNIVYHYSFFPGEPKWPHYKRNLTYSFRLGTQRDARAPIRRALKMWQGMSHFKFIYKRNYVSADIKISFRKRSHGDGVPFDGRGGVVAHAFAPTDGRLHFDADENWSVDVRSDALDIQTVGLHELGHVLGLGHTNVYAAVMYPSIGPGRIKSLHEDDIRGIKALYRISDSFIHD